MPAFVLQKFAAVSIVIMAFRVILVRYLHLQVTCNFLSNNNIHVFH